MAVEIELRGPLTKSDFQRLAKFLQKEGRFKEIKKRITYVFYTKDKTLDLKIRTTNGKSEMVVKKGFWGARRREEITLPIKTESVPDAQKLLAALGYKEGIIATRVAQVFEYQGVEMALIKCPKDYYFYEAEFLGGKSSKNPESQIKKVLKSLKLKFWTEKEVLNFLMFCNREFDKHFFL